MMMSREKLIHIEASVSVGMQELVDEVVALQTEVDTLRSAEIGLTSEGRTHFRFRCRSCGGHKFDGITPQQPAGPNFFSVTVACDYCCNSFHVHIQADGSGLALVTIAEPAADSPSA